jgi:hypothetical protein
MEITASKPVVPISNSAKERLLRRLNESEDKTCHFIREGTSLPSGITLSTFLSKAREEVEEPAHKRSAQLSS